MTLISNKSIVKIKSLHKSFYIGDGQTPVLNGISFDILENEYISIMGPSGSGKSTLLHIIGCLDTPTSGEYSLDGIRVDSLDDEALSNIRGTKIGFVFQSFNLINNMSVLENVMLPMYYQHINDNKQIEISKELLNKMNLSHRLNHKANQLSGGERQRVAIARSLVNKPKLLLADEPTGNLDSKTENTIIDLFNKLHEELKLTIIMITHSEKIGKLTKRTIKLLDGKIVENN